MVANRQLFGSLAVERDHPQPRQPIGEAGQIGRDDIAQGRIETACAIGFRDRVP